jgi:hypothetical protein
MTDGEKRSWPADLQDDLTTASLYALKKTIENDDLIGDVSEIGMNGILCESDQDYKKVVAHLRYEIYLEKKRLQNRKRYADERQRLDGNGYQARRRDENGRVIKKIETLSREELEARTEEKRRKARERYHRRNQSGVEDPGWKPCYLCRRQYIGSIDDHEKSVWHQTTLRFIKKHGENESNIMVESN